MMPVFFACHLPLAALYAHISPLCSSLPDALTLALTLALSLVFTLIWAVVLDYGSRPWLWIVVGRGGEEEEK
ncbi:hypothetical protein PCI56_20860 [Plesiomonas shigelloides subsp. oncorhynchi]|nr:hypothetical protein [Plesiomonas shigelloides]